jgi:hypothetical protein
LYNFKILYVKKTENAKIDALSKKLKYFFNKTHINYAVLKQNGDSLVFNKKKLFLITKIKYRVENLKFFQVYKKNFIAIKAF